jgi:T5SS/PEP-CTERM-associated repeat protein
MAHRSAHISVHRTAPLLPDTVAILAAPTTPPKATSWTGKGNGTLWTNATNWSHGVPVSGQVVNFTDGGSWNVDLNGTGAAAGEMTVLGDSLTFGRHGQAETLTLNAPVPKHGSPVDLLIGGNGAVSLNNVTLVAEHAVQLGYFGSTETAGALTLSRHAALETPALYVYDGVVTLDKSVIRSIGTSSFIRVAGAAGTSLVLEDGAKITTAHGANSFLDIGWGGTGNGLVSVDGAKTLLAQSTIQVGDGYSGTLTVHNGATVQARLLLAGNAGDGTISVTSGGILHTTTNTLIGGLVPVSSSLSVTNGGTFIGDGNGLTLDGGFLHLDSTASFTSTIRSVSGNIFADAGPGGAAGTVTLDSKLTISAASGLQFGNICFLGSTGGATLNMEGSISGSAVLYVGNGNVELSHVQNSYLGQTSLYNGSLTIGANGAAGKSTFTFANPYTQGTGTGQLVIGAGVIFHNVITGVGASDTIDLNGFAFGHGVSQNFNNGTLTLQNDTGKTSLIFNTGDNSLSFTVADDHHGGTLLGFHP